MRGQSKHFAVHHRQQVSVHVEVFRITHSHVRVNALDEDLLVRLVQSVFDGVEEDLKVQVGDTLPLCIVLGPVCLELVLPSI